MTKSDILMLCRLQELHTIVEGMKADNEKCRIQKEEPVWVLDDFIRVQDILSIRASEYRDEKPPRGLLTRIFSKIF